MPRLLVVLLYALLALLPALASASRDTVTVQVFWREGCPHCEKEIAFLQGQTAALPWLQLEYHEIGSSRTARELFVATAQRFGETPNAVPFTVVGDRYFVGYLDDATSGAAIVAAAHAARSEPAVQASAQPAPAVPHTTAAVPAQLHVPLVGMVDTAQLSLPLLTITLAAIDGFNPCAMWALVFLLGLLVGLRDHRRMWVLGVTFVVASALVYFLFMTAWLNLVLFVGALGWLRYAIGLLALAGGGWYLYEWKTRRDAQCQVSAAPARRRVLDGLRAMAQRQQLPIALVGIVLLAFAVNLIELVCSAGIPAVYTQVLAMTPMSTAAHYAYLALYILVFMLDDLFVLGATLLTLQVTGLTGRYTHAATLVGGLVLLALGLAMIFRPGWLTFG